MTIYRLKSAPNAGPFQFATLAVLFALLKGISTEWEAVAE